MTRVGALVLLAFLPACAFLDALDAGGDPDERGVDEDVDEDVDDGEEGEGEGEGEGEPVGCASGLSGPLLTARIVAVGFDRSCALRCDGTITCWGNGSEVTPPAGTFNDVTVGQTFACGRRANGAAECWGQESFTLGVNSFSIAAGQSFLCGLDGVARIVCEGETSFPEFFIPSGSFNSLVAGWGYICGQRLDTGALQCGGTTGAPVPPSVELVEVGVGSRFACGLDDDGAAVCFDDEGPVPAPPGVFLGLGVGDGTACAIRADDESLSCWTETEEGQRVVDDAPSGRFQAVSVADSHACAIRTDSAVLCWGNELQGRIDVPAP